jgi:hypothetical protein
MKQLGKDWNVRLDNVRMDNVWRQATAVLKGYIEGVDPVEICKARYPDDRLTLALLERAATTQATTADAAWAGPLTHTAIEQSVEDIVAMSVAWRLALAGALRVDLGNVASVTVPGRSVHAADAGTWVGEGQPIPVRQMNLYPGATLRPTKVACIVTMTRELTEASNIEAVVRQLLTEAAGIAIDAAMFSAAPASGVQPAGLLNGLTALPPTSTSTLGFDSCAQDLGVLVQDVATRGGGRKIFFVAAPAQAIAIRFWAGGQFSVTPATDVLPVAASVGLPVGSVVAIEPESLAFAIGDPQFTVSKVAALHMEDTTPQNIGGAVPVKSMYQIDAFALKMTVRATWGMRAPHTSFMNAVQW